MSTPAAVFADLADWPKLALSGPGCLEWLAGAVGADLSGLAQLRSVRASFGGARLSICVVGGSVLLVASPADRAALDELTTAARRIGLQVDDRSDELALFAFPNTSEPPCPAGSAISAPSCLGAGADLFALADDAARLRAMFDRRYARVVAAGPID